MEELSLLNRFRERPQLRHLKRLTTKDGLIQHADFDVPDPSFGYSIDDNARALIVCLWHYKIFQDPSILQLADIYFNYLKRVERQDGTFHNFVSFSEKILDHEGSEDSIGRAVWALGEVIASQPGTELAERAQTILKRSIIDKHLDHEHVRTKAYILLGLLSAGLLDDAKKWADKLKKIFHTNSKKDWVWFEDGLYYANGILPYALARAAIFLNDKELEEIAVKTFHWLDEVSTHNGVPSPIGQDGWYQRGKEKALYDQQPLEAADMVLAAGELFLLTKETEYLKRALTWYEWYEGKNTQQKTLINTTTGGVYDALTPAGVNSNQGAESIVTYLLAYLKLAQIAKDE
jgi:uncharacterized protein YyaL (SSP411 family)